MRTVDISKTNGERNILADISVNPAYDFYASNVYAGGICGIAYNAIVSDFVVDGGDLLKATATSHSYAGGAFGLIDGTVAADGVVDVDIEIHGPVGNGLAFNIGGVAGYVINNSLLKNITVETVEHLTIVRQAEAYAGGIAGTVNDSTVENCSASGGYVVGESANTVQEFYSIAASTSDLFVKNLAGAVGLYLGESTLTGITVDFVAYHGGVAAVFPKIEVVYETGEDGKKKATDVEEYVISPDSIGVTYYSDNSAAKLYSENQPYSTAASLKMNSYGEAVNR
jgi:hypothetical protein